MLTTILLVLSCTAIASFHPTDPFPSQGLDAASLRQAANSANFYVDANTQFNFTQLNIVDKLMILSVQFIGMPPPVHGVDQPPAMVEMNVTIDSCSCMTPTVSFSVSRTALPGSFLPEPNDFYWSCWGITRYILWRPFVYSVVNFSTVCNGCKHGNKSFFIFIPFILNDFLLPFTSRSWLSGDWQ